MVKPLRKQSGAVLILALLALTIVATMSVMYLDVSTSLLENQHLSLNRLQAQALSDGALDRGIQALKNNPALRGDAGSLKDTFGSYTLEVTEVDGDLEVTARCSVEGAEVAATARVEVTGWTERRKINFKNSGQSEDLINFPVLVSLDTVKFDYSKTRDGGQDLRFADEDGTLLAHEIEAWDSSGISHIWVNVPLIDRASTRDHIWMYYSNPEAADGQNATAVWDSNHLLVWHLADRDGATIKDSTANGNSGSKQSITEPQATAAGMIGRAQQFDGVNDGIEVDGLTPSVDITLEAWVRPASFVLDKWGTIAQFKSDKPFLGFVESDDVKDAPVLNFWRGKKEIKGQAIMAQDVWSYVVATHDGSSARIYLNGTLDQSGSISDTKIGRDFYVGIWETDTTDSAFDGIIDEVRVSTTVRSPDWIAAQYLVMNGAFCTLSAGEATTEFAELEELWRRTGE